MADPFSAADGAERRLVASLPAGDNAAPLSVSELAGALKRTVEDRFGHVRVRGEISGFKRAASGHCYLTLKDADACLDAVLWRTAAQRLAFAPEDGVEVIATGRLTTYPNRSRYQIVVESLELAGEGALMLLFERLRQRLAGEGLFSRPKRPLPLIPQAIGVVTSPTGAVIRDVLHRLADRFPSHVLVWPVPVQGEGAAERIAAAITGFCAMPHGGATPRPDLLIVARGGGSIEDLWAFNEEVVVRAVAGSAIPVISAVGHETDTTLTDHAADHRAPTPTAAAERAVPVLADLQRGLGDCALRLDAAVRRVHERGVERLAAATRALPRREELTRPQEQRFDELAERLRCSLGTRLDRAATLLARNEGALRPALLRRRLELAEGGLRTLTRTMAQLDPDAPLERGYTMVKDGEGALVTSAAAARAAGRVELRFARGESVAADVAGAAAATRAPGAPRRRAAAPDNQERLF